MKLHKIILSFVSALAILLSSSVTSFAKVVGDKIVLGSLGKLKISDEGVRQRDELVIDNFSSKKIPICGVLGGGYNKDFNKLIELHSLLHQSCAKLL